MTALLLAVAPISPLAAEIRGRQLTVLYPISVITRRDCIWRKILNKDLTIINL